MSPHLLAWPPLWRLTASAGGLILFASLFVAWDAVPGSGAAIDGWSAYGATDLALALLAGAIVAGAVLGPRIRP